MGILEAICISENKNELKAVVPDAQLKVDWGIVGDAHAGNWHRQVSLLAGESIDKMKKKIPDLARGAFAENMIIRGIDVLAIKIGDQLQIGETIVEITQIGKECHNDCAIKIQTGDCIMPREGLFAKVIKAGKITPGDKVAVVVSS